MNNFSPLFGTALARSGGGVYCNCLSVNSEIMLANCPNIEFFREFRNSTLRNLNIQSVLEHIPATASLQDYYGHDVRMTALDAMLNSDLEIPFNIPDWDQFLENSIARGALDAKDLVQFYDELKGNSFREVMDNLLGVIAKARRSENRKWIGFHEVWVIDSFPALARAYPDAKFVINFRDPRASVFSMLGVVNIDPSQVAQILSYARHWRKYASLALKFKNDPLFAGRLHLTAHESILIHPEESVRKICDFLEVDFTTAMLDTNEYIDFATGKTWQGNSSFEENTQGIKASRATRWRDKINPTVLSAVEYLCGPDLKLVGYSPLTKYADPHENASNDIIEYLLNEHSAYTNWRSDLGDPLHDLGLEAVRRSLLTLKEASQDTSLIRKLFLFEETYKQLRSSNQKPLINNL